jgi:hypothetical protein
MLTKKQLLVFAGVVLLVAGNAAAKAPPDSPSRCAPDCVRQNPVKVSAPEIDIRSGGSAIALLITAMLIAAERTHRTRK